jgi:hypothetical protein
MIFKSLLRGLSYLDKIISLSAWIVMLQVDTLPFGCFRIVMLQFDTLPFGLFRIVMLQVDTLPFGCFGL